jgi:hypothetical protein
VRILEIAINVHGGSIWRMPKPSTPNSHKTTPSGSTARQDSSQAPFYEAIEILAKKGNKYKVAWAGINPATGKQWEPSWVQAPVCGQHVDSRNRRRIAADLCLLLGPRNSRQRLRSRERKVIVTIPVL